MNSLTAVATGPFSWDFYHTVRDEFVGSIRFEVLNVEKKTCELFWDAGDVVFERENIIEAHQRAIGFAIFDLKFVSVNTASAVDDLDTQNLYETVGFVSGRDFSKGKFRYRRFSADRYDLVIKLATTFMGQHLDIGLWSFGFDSAKKRLGVCKYDQHLISLSRYFVDLHSLAEIDQVIRHEVAHALAGPKAGHGAKWKKIATDIGYNHKKISGDEIGNATAKLIGTCPNGHTVYRHRKPKTQLSCSRCATKFDRNFLITWTTR
jgi:predicted SprT family Zn-dependent metalloprotease